MLGAAFLLSSSFLQCFAQTSTSGPVQTPPPSPAQTTIPSPAQTATSGPAIIPIESDKPLWGSLVAGQTSCYQFSLDATATREVVYWPAAKIYVRLEPCTGLPHLRASVHGCPSDGHVVNWEYQSERARNDLRASGEPVPAEWEWVGDVESLSIDVTHRNFYIEVSNYFWPLRTNASMSELSRRLQVAEFPAQADEVDDMMFVGRMGPTEVARLKSFEGLLMPPSTFKLGVYLHDATYFPEDNVLPLQRTPGWDRDIRTEEASVLVVGQADDPYSGNYLITFWPPTRKANTSSSSSSAAPLANTSSTPTTARRSLEQEDEDAEEEAMATLGGRLAPEHAQRLRAMRRAGQAVTWGHVESMLGPEHAAELETARRLLAPSDVILHPDPRYLPKKEEEESRSTAARRALSGEEEARRVEKIRAERAQVQQQLRTLQGVEGFEAAAAAGAAKYPLLKAQQHEAEATRALERAGGVEGGGGRRALMRGSLSVNGSVGNYSMVQRWQHALSDNDLQYMIYWVDLTAAVKARWGTMTDALGNSYTRLFDEPCDASNLRCGIKQLIRQQTFTRWDADQDGTLSRAEFDLAYPPSLQADDPGFVNGSTFEEVAASSVGGVGIDALEFEAKWAGAAAVLDASIKDPLLRNYWTTCGVQRSGTPVVPSGNVSLDSRRAEWLSIRSFDQLEDGRLARSLKGLDDSDNNVYAINVVVRNVVTGEQAVYKPHVLQRKTPLYVAPDATGPAQMGIIIASACSIGAIVLLFLLAIWFTRRRKTKPRIRIKKAQD